MWAEQLDRTGFLQTTLLCYSGDSSKLLPKVFKNYTKCGWDNNLCFGHYKARHVQVW